MLSYLIFNTQIFFPLVPHNFREKEEAQDLHKEMGEILKASLDIIFFLAVEHYVEMKVNV